MISQVLVNEAAQIDNDLIESPLRMSALMRLVPLDELDAGTCTVLAPSCGSGGMYGALVPSAGSGWPIKGVSREEALVLLTLCKACRIPNLLLSVFGEDAALHLWRLIFEGV